MFWRGRGVNCHVCRHRPSQPRESILVTTSGGIAAIAIIVFDEDRDGMCHWSRWVLLEAPPQHLHEVFTPR